MGYSGKSRRFVLSTFLSTVVYSFIIAHCIFFLGLSLAGVAGICNFDLTILKALLFGSLISAVDPVAVSI